MNQSHISDLLKWGCSICISLVLLPFMALVSIYRPFGFKVLRLWSRLQVKIFGIKIVFENRAGRPLEAGSFLFVGVNQESLIEALVWPAVIPRDAYFVMNVEFMLIPILGWALLIAGHITVVRQWATQSRWAVDRCIKLLQTGNCVGIQIFGERRPDAKIGKYKKGPVIMAIRAQVPIVPVAVHGASECLTFGDWKIKPGTIRYVLLPMIETRGMAYQHRDAIIAKIRELAKDELGSKKFVDI
jgi:1-acyl-sn-glycerol-3-phosphate acyltransferase